MYTSIQEVLPGNRALFGCFPLTSSCSKLWFSGRFSPMLSYTTARPKLPGFLTREWRSLWPGESYGSCICACQKKSDGPRVLRGQSGAVRLEASVGRADAFFFALPKRTMSSSFDRDLVQQRLKTASRSNFGDSTHSMSVDTEVVRKEMSPCFAG